MSILYLPGKKTKEKIYIYIYGRDFLEFFCLSTCGCETRTFKSRLTNVFFFP